MALCRHALPVAAKPCSWTSHRHQTESGLPCPNLFPPAPAPTALYPQLIQKSSVKAVHVLSSAADLRLAVAGQTPKVALEVAHAAIQFCELAGGGEAGGGLN